MEKQPDKIYLTLTDDTELECNILGVFEVDKIEYIALLPMEEDQVLLYKFLEEDEEIELENIEEDDEFERVAEVFNELFVEDETDHVEHEK